MHWGETIEAGSEHLIDKEPYAAEVTMNKIIYIILKLQIKKN